MGSHSFRGAINNCCYKQDLLIMLSWSNKFQQVLIMKISWHFFLRCHSFQIYIVPFLPGAFFSGCHFFRCHFFWCHFFRCHFFLHPVGTETAQWVYHEGSIRWPIAPWVDILYFAPFFSTITWTHPNVGYMVYKIYGKGIGMAVL